MFPASLITFEMIRDSCLPVKDLCRENENRDSRNRTINVKTILRNCPGATHVNYTVFGHFSVVAWGEFYTLM